MKNNAVISLVFLLLVRPCFSQTESFPEVISWKKNPLIELENKKILLLQKNLNIKNSFTVVTLIDDELVLKFSGGDEIIVLPKSKVTVPQVSPDTGDVSEVFVNEGSVRYKSPELQSARSKLRLKSVFFDLKIPPAVDVLVNLNTSLPRVQIQVVSGEMKAEFLDFEKKQILKSGESISFDGEFEDSKKNENIKYDYLLDGRKSPHGVLGLVEKFDYSKFVKQEQDKVQKALIDLQKQKQADALKKKKQKAYEDSFLCRKPFGQREECYWIKKIDKCFRYRCNVSGQWGDETERPLDLMGTRCKSEPQVGRCDF